MRRRVILALLVAACLLALLAAVATGGDDEKAKTFEIVFDNAFGLVEGGDVKIGGVKAGVTKRFELTKSEPYRVVVTAELTEPGLDALREDATCAVRQQSLIGEYFVDCDLGGSERRLPDGGRVPVEQTSSTIPPDLINTIMRRPYRERFRLIIGELGAGLAGRPEELNEVVRRAHPALRETSQTLAVLRRQNRTIRDFIRDADTVSRSVAPVRDELARWAEEAAEAAGIQASRSEQLGRYWNRLPEFLGELEPTMIALRGATERQTPTLRKLGGAAPELERFLEDVRPFARATEATIGDLGELALAGRAALRESREEIDELRRLAAFAPSLGKPLRQFLETIDDRRRSTERDPIAEETAPPAPDKTAYRAGQGFTGMEGLWNYVYYQTLTTNGFDEFGHVLRIGGLAGTACSPYSAKPSRALIAECASWLGPDQPGINSPDPTRSGVAERERSERRSSTLAERERHRGEGEPEAPPTPGRPDPSEPQIVLPDGLRELLRSGRRPSAGQPALDAGSAALVLDYLLGS